MDGPVSVPSRALGPPAECSRGGGSTLPISQTEIHFGNAAIARRLATQEQVRECVAIQQRLPQPLPPRRDPREEGLPVRARRARVAHAGRAEQRQLWRCRGEPLRAEPGVGVPRVDGAGGGRRVRRVRGVRRSLPGPRGRGAELQVSRLRSGRGRERRSGGREHGGQRVRPRRRGGLSRRQRSPLPTAETAGRGTGTAAPVNGHGGAPGGGYGQPGQPASGSGYGQPASGYGQPASGSGYGQPASGSGYGQAASGSGSGFGRGATAGAPAIGTHGTQVVNAGSSAQPLAGVSADVLIDDEDSIAETKGSQRLAGVPGANGNGEPPPESNLAPDDPIAHVMEARRNVDGSVETVFGPPLSR